MNSVSYTVRVPVQAQIKIFEMAKKYGYQPSHFVQLIFDAAFAARVGIERGAEPADRELDQMCRAVFCLAGQFDSAAIAKATGVAESLVGRILEAWRSEELRQRRPMAKAAATPSTRLRGEDSKARRACAPMAALGEGDEHGDGGVRLGASVSGNGGVRPPHPLPGLLPAGGEKEIAAEGRALGIGARKVLAALRSNARPDGTVSISQGELAEQCGISKNTTGYQLKALARQGLVGLVKAGSARGGSAVYRLNPQANGG